MARLQRQVSADSGVSGCGPHRVCPGVVLDVEMLLTMTTRPPPNSRLITTQSPQHEQIILNLDQTNKTASVDENNNEVKEKRIIRRKAPIDYTLLAVLMSFPAPFVGLPALWYAHKCKREQRRGDVHRAWEYSWKALYYVLSGLFCVFLLCLGILIIIVLSFHFPLVLDSETVTSQLTTTDSSAKVLSFSISARVLSTETVTPSPVSKINHKKHLHKLMSFNRDESRPNVTEKMEIGLQKFLQDNM